MFLIKKTIYSGSNIRISAESITIDEVAETFADLFGKDVILNPLTPHEMTVLPIPAARPMAKMCQFLGNKISAHDIEATKAIMFPRRPRVFRDWLLINSGKKSFEMVGLSTDPSPILSVTVFGATSLQGISVVKGLLADSRKCYEIRAATRDVTSEKAEALQALDPDRVTLAQADYNDIRACTSALDGVEGAFLAIDFFSGDATVENIEVWERYARNIIDACVASKSVRHIVFSTMNYVQDNKEIYSSGGFNKHVEKIVGGVWAKIDIKACAAAYARTKKLSCTFMLIPCYPEIILDLIKSEKSTNEETGGEIHIFTIPQENGAKVGCMSFNDLGPAVANIFDSYQVIHNSALDI